jgi:hypothetical protein
MQDYKSFYSDVVKEDYPATWNKDEFEKITSYSTKLKYANEHLTKLATGSGRAVFKIDEQKVLKIAKNKKGLAQNSVEADGYIQNFDVVARTYDTGDDIHDIGPFWVEMELAKKIGKPRFKQLTGVPIENVHAYLVKYMGKGQRWPAISDEEAKKLDNNEFIMEMMDLVGNYDMAVGDFGRTSTYGEVVRDGKSRVVLVDFGLTNTVWDDYYKVKI